MAGARHPSIANINAITKRLLKEREKLLKLLKSIPDMDAYANLYSVLSYHVKHINECLEGVKPGFRIAQEVRKKHPNCALPNRAKPWKHH